MNEFRAGRVLLVPDVQGDARLTPDERLATARMGVGAEVVPADHAGGAGDAVLGLDQGVPTVVDDLRVVDAREAEVLAEDPGSLPLDLDRVGYRPEGVGELDEESVAGLALAQRRLAEILELSGYRVCITGDARSGLELARELTPDAIVCDIGLPDTDGYGFAKAARREPALRRTLLVALTGYAQPEDRERAREAGFDAHLPKPPPIEELQRLLLEGGAGPPR